MERVRASSTFELISFWEIQRRVISGGCYHLFLCRLSLRSVQVSNLSSAGACGDDDSNRDDNKDGHNEKDGEENDFHHDDD